MEIKALKILADFIVRRASKEQLKTSLSKVLEKVLKDVPEVQRWPTALEAMVTALEKPTEDLGLTSDEMIELVDRLGKPRTLRRVVFKKLSPNQQEARPDLSEDFGATPGTSFTSSANAAPYAKPIGGMMRRNFWSRKKRNRYNVISPPSRRALKN